MTTEQINTIITHILELEQEGVVTRTFRRLDPDRQLQIIHAIIGEAALRGPTAINVKQLAERAGVAVGSLYQYFGNREQLLDFAVSLSVRFNTELIANVRTTLVALPLAEGLRQYFVGSQTLSETSQGFYQFYVQAAHQADRTLKEQVILPIARVHQDLIRSMLLAARERGELRAELDLEAAVRVVNVCMAAVSDSMILPQINDYFQMFDDTVSQQQAVDALVDLILRGIGLNAEQEDD